MDPGKKVRKLGEDEAFKRALQEVIKLPGPKIYDSRNPKLALSLDPTNGCKSANYYYGVRSNISHRGKGTWKDGNIVLNALTQLENIFTLVLERKGLRRPPSTLGAKHDTPPCQ